MNYIRSSQVYCYETSLLKTIAIYKTLGLLFHKIFQWLCTLALGISCCRKIKHRRVVISSLVTFLISVRNNACILRTGCQVRKAVLLYKLIIDLKLKNMQIQINLYVVIICSTTVIFDNGSIIIIWHISVM
jgi:hypothetical protein